MADNGAADAKAVAAQPAAAGGAAANNNNAPPVWAAKSLRQKCDCHMCLVCLLCLLVLIERIVLMSADRATLRVAQAGKTTELHADASHDQSLQQSIKLGDTRLSLTGGTTKCARVAVGYFASLCDADATRDFWRGQHVLEVGAGTGLVGIALAALGARVTLTDQAPVLDLLQYNVDANAATVREKGGAASVAELYFGAGLDAFKRPPQAKPQEANSNAVAQSADGKPAAASAAKDAAASAKTAAEQWHSVIGSDLIYAKETIEPLVATYLAICGSNPSGKTSAYLVSIERFEWEKQFFVLMSQHFTQTRVYQLGDIRIDKFDLMPAATPVCCVCWS